ncbi:MAG: ribonuclease III [Leptolyngbyaceae cyanobacterium bins.349]|nr:ribonuclease III [Leptolyngbyaceae cyanobacterium bins.349]
MAQAFPHLPPFQDDALRQRAFTHRSYVNENASAQNHNERLEFLGDAILNFLSGEFLYKRYPQKSEGELTPLRSLLVDAKQLAAFAVQLNLGEQLRLGRGGERDGGRTNPRILSSAFEALIGAYFLDTHSDVDQVRNYVEPFFASVVSQFENLPTESTVNYKSRFQEWALATHTQNPEYLTLEASGPDHAKTFVIEVQVNGTSYGQGSGRKKQEAEKDAARNALDRLGLL